MTTNEFAEKIGILPRSIHRRVCQTGSYYGLKPLQLANRRLLWPDNAIEQLTAQQPKRAANIDAEADHAAAPLNGGAA